MSELYKLRPHHILCIMFFEGKGYSEDFVENMYAVKERLSDNLQQIIPTVNEDIICTVCPNNNNGVCVSQEKVCGFDRKVLDLCGAAENTPILLSEITDSAIKNIIEKNLLKTVCGSCEWNYICLAKADRMRKL